MKILDSMINNLKAKSELDDKAVRKARKKDYKRHLVLNILEKTVKELEVLEEEMSDNVKGYLIKIGEDEMFYPDEFVEELLIREFKKQVENRDESGKN